MPPQYCDWSALLGFYGEKAARTILRTLGLNRDIENEILRQVAEAREYASSIEGRLAVNPTVEPIPETHRSYLADLESTPIIDEVVEVGMRTWSFGLVELEKLHVFQPYMNLEYVGRLIEKAPSPDDSKATLKYCLPIRMEDTSANEEVSVTFDAAQNTYSIVSENLDLRMIGNSQAEDDFKRKFVGFSYGFGLPQVFVAQFKDLLFLKNGYHRAYSLLKKGHKTIPCIVLKVDSLSQMGVDRSDQYLPSEVILSDRSPILSDYHTRAAVTIPRRRARAVLTIHAGVEVVQL